MDDPSSPAPKTAAEYRAIVDGYLAAIKQMNEQSNLTRGEIERLKAETEAIKADTEVIKARLQSRLDALQARFP